MKVKAFITHKLSEKYSDCQDYFVIDKDSRAIAVSDGMSQSVFPGWWAEILTKKFATSSKSVSIKDCLPELQKEWRTRVDEYIQKSKKEGKNPWRLENCIAERKGAGATLCGVRFEGQKWDGVVLGDTCLIEVDANNHVIQLYPKQENGFGNHPDYFDSMEEGKGELIPISGDLPSDCKLLIVSDPFAELIYKKSLENSEVKIIERMLQVSSHAEFEQLVDDFRQNEKMHNDDSTMVLIEYDGEDKINIAKQDYLTKLIEQEHKAEKTAENVSKEEVAKQNNETPQPIVSEKMEDTPDKGEKAYRENIQKELETLKSENKRLIEENKKLTNKNQKIERQLKEAKKIIDEANNNRPNKNRTIKDWWKEFMEKTNNLFER